MSVSEVYGFKCSSLLVQNLVGNLVHQALHNRKTLGPNMLPHPSCNDKCSIDDLIVAHVFKEASPGPMLTVVMIVFSHLAPFLESVHKNSAIHAGHIGIDTHLLVEIHHTFSRVDLRTNGVKF